ncbi:SDR family NAD(P)-dependent oxidoreductase [Paenibacillus sp. UMB4589-SE434]|uniref:SDR family NAD(P)-dependent oxidoreductase n=1 Tax=Paenibacillus sp. UMB4589-SE434 TaxID=3046314 RepID=UPI00254B34D3|nr:SDR family NAD(P)-dependent oxidoreductase [Paenibacillus sp. UMB4589-SE434]MDK8180302.1 SDR family NAD(P)-dependent oxidoreductase [Paenibacillus sp. UMB4589-SE434]
MHTEADYDYIHLQKQHMHEMGELLVKLLWEQLRTLELFTDSATLMSSRKAAANLSPVYDKWLHVTTHFLKDFNYIVEDGDNFYSLMPNTASADSAWGEWEYRKAAWLEDSNTKSQAILAETMLRALPQILTGKKAASEIMFPNSSLSLVEGIYKHNQIADYFNERLADTIVSYIQEHLRRDPSARIRMLEIGAGTGGTSATVFRRLEPYRQHMEEYCYTDVSKAFLLHAEKEYGAENPFLTYKMLNIEQSIIDQGIELGGYHIVIAANVLHATQNIRHTLRHVKALLQKNGLLVLNEITDRTLFNHVTFGLLQGWWLYEDETRRIPGCPGLYCESWKKSLEIEGYHSINFPTSDAKALGQQIIAAGSDGRIRLTQKAKSHILDCEAADNDAATKKKKEAVVNTELELCHQVTDSVVAAHVKHMIMQNISESLKVELHLIDHDESFSDYGVDSITGVQLVRFINRTLKVDLESTDLFDYNSVNQLAKHILSQHADALKQSLAQHAAAAEEDSMVAPIRQNKRKNTGATPTNRFSRAEGTSAARTETKAERTDIAIIGMSGRFAGSTSVDELWTHLASGTDLIQEVSRWNLAEYYPEGAEYCKFGSFVDNIDQFDPLFFNISGIEATYMDPQQRIFLELAWSALEDAGYAGAGVQGKTCGVYVGSGGTDYLHILGDNPPAQAFWGNSGSLIPARIAYYLDLQGPAIAVDTACSSSLVAIHLACQALWAGEIEMALAGGVFIQSTPNLFLCSNRAGMLSPTGRCHTFDERADGFVPGEGAGAIVMKRLEDAIADGDQVYAVIRGSGINQDGTTNGITAPSAKSQERLERHVYDTFGIHPEQIQMVEAHGTGTQLGDPIEYKALTRAFRNYTDKAEFCALGSIKSNIGHLTVAAGIAGVIKILLSLKHKQIPPSLHFRVGNSNINFTDSPFYINTSLKDWTVNANTKRCAAVSSFGFSGTNAHIVLEEAPRVERKHSEQPSYIVVLSARSLEQLRIQARQLAAYCETDVSVNIGNMSYTLLLGRKHMNCRLACVVQDPDELSSLLKAWLDTGTASGLYVSVLDRNEQQHQNALARSAGNQSIQECKQASDTSRFLASLSAVADLFVQGYELEYSELFDGGGYSRISLPTYPFARERYWVQTQQKPSASKTTTTRSLELDHPSMQEATGIVMLEPIWEERPVSRRAELATYTNHIVILCEESDIGGLHKEITSRRNEVSCIRLLSEHNQLERRFEDYASAAFTEIQSIIQSKPEGFVLVQIVVPREGEAQLYAGLAGLLKTARLENPKLIGQLFEIEPGEAPTNDWIGKLKDNGQAPQDVHIRYNEGKRWVSTWRECEHAMAAEESQKIKRLPWKDGGIYLITGGTGGLGFVLANDIARQVKGAVLILTGRTELNEEKHAKLMQLETVGAQVQYYKTDVTDCFAVNRLIREIRDTWSCLDGILHCAGIIQDNYILKKTAAELRSVLAPKVSGTVYLDEASKGMDLDFFLLFSSLTGILGNPGQADYAMANAFMDQYAVYRNKLVAEKKRHGVSVSINWPLWREGGMHVGGQIEAMMKQATGMTGMTSEMGLSALYEAFVWDKQRLMVLAGDIPKLKHFFLHADDARTDNPTDVQSADHVFDKGRIKRLRELMLARFRLFFAEEIKVTVDQIDVHEPLEHYGIDSILVMQLNEKLEQRYGSISKTLFYEYRTLHEIANALVSNYPEKCAEWTNFNESATVTDIKPASTFGRKTITSVTNDKVNQDASNSQLMNREQQKDARPDLADGEDEPIAIIGLSGQYPQAPNLKAFWSNLKQGKDCIGEIPQERWSLEHFYDPDRKEAFARGKSYSKWGGFIDGFAEFDPRFFAISPREAMNIDPQERLFLQTCWEALEDAGYTKELISERHKGRVGVYAGVTKTGYALHGPTLIGKGGELFPFTSFGSIANRVSYLFNLKGPSMPLDTMCSSSLTAVHIACEHLRHGECEMAIAGGVNLYLHPSNYVELCGGQMLSSDGKCKSFGAGANGFVPGEGVGAIILKPLAKAIADGDHIYAVIRATSMNHGGKTNGYRVPNPTAQGELVREAIEKAGIHARTISYIEAHGTGTELGDPIEITGLCQAFAKDTEDTNFCAIGSVKSNIGHLEAAAGIAGITKVILQMKHGQLAPSLHAGELNPNIFFSSTPFAVQQTLGEWKRPVMELDGKCQEYPRIAGVSSFGAGGVNAHVILEEYVTQAVDVQSTASSSPPALIVLSAKNEERLMVKAKQLLAFIEEEGCTDINIANLAYTLQVGREAMDERLSLIAGSVEEIQRKLSSYVDGQLDLQEVFRGNVKRNKEALALFTADEEMVDTVNRWFERGKYVNLLELWVKGFEIDWETMYVNSDNKPRRMSLPTYPFVNEQYWVAKDIQPLTSITPAHMPLSAKPLQDDNALVIGQQTTDHQGVYETMTFEEVWQEEELTELPALQGDRMKIVICFLSDTSNQQEISAELRMIHSQTYIIFITAGTHFCKVAANMYSILPNEGQSYKEAFRSIREEHGDVDTVLYLWAMEDRKWVREYSGILYMLQAMHTEQIKPHRLLLAGEFAEGLEFCYLDAWNGFKQSLRLVMPKMRVHVICKEAVQMNLESTMKGSKGRLTHIVEELHAEAAQSVLYRQGKRYVSQIQSVELVNACARSVRSGGTYLITGGTGGLGLIFAEALAKKYAVNLILIGRALLNTEKQSKINKIVELGSKVLFVQADVCDLDGMREGIRLARQQFGGISGVIHAAGLMSNHHVFEKSMDDFSRIVAPKITGTLVLDEVLKGEALDFICYFSSTAAILGDFGSCDYAVANRFQMSYAHHRNQIEPGKALVINWPLWRHGGMGFGNDSATHMYMKTSGQRLLENDEGIALFEQMLLQQKSQFMILAGQRERVHRFLGLVAEPIQNPVYLERQQESQEQKQSHQYGQANNVREFGAASTVSRTGMRGLSVEKCVELDLKQLAGQLLQIPIEQLDIDDHLAEFGFDSIGLANFAEKIALHYQVDISPALFFEYSTLLRITEYVLSTFPDTIQAFYREVAPQEAASTLAPISAPDTSPSTAASSILFQAEWGQEEMQISVDVESPSNSALSAAEPIAIIGMSGRFPQARSVDELWSILAEGREVITDMVAVRPYIRGVQHSTCKGGFVPGVNEFDPLFFEISPREAETMDPRQRLLLQESWNALEDAGYGEAQLKHNCIGMFVGIENNDDYVKLVGSDASITSNHNAILAARLSYFLNLTGPNMAINTACSSGLVAVHQACMSLRLAECDTAVAAGVGLMLSVEPFEVMKQAGMLSEEGRCYAFDRRANGMVPGEAVAALVLKRLSRAEEDGDPIYAVIRGSGINYDGKTNGITAPSGMAQANLLKDVYRKYDINPEEIEYIVTHGTGTKLGDPVEVNALVNAFQTQTNKERYCALTSTKTNLGHTLAASGIVSLISLVQAMRRETIPASLHCEQENEYIQWKNSPFYVNKQNRSWAENSGSRRIGAVSSFGMSGTNAHLVVQSYVRKRQAKTSNDAPYYLLPLSAKTEEALQEKIQQMIAILDDHAEKPQQSASFAAGQSLSEISYTLLAGRHHFKHRCAIVVVDREDAVYTWTQAKLMEKRPNIFRSTVPRDFEGQAALRQYMHELMRQSKETVQNMRKHQESLYAMADLYCQGYDIPIELMDVDGARPVRVHLPPYPFAKEHYWAEAAVSSKSDSTGSLSTQQYHPLLQHNTSSFAEQRFSSTFTGDEFFLSDHKVMGSKVLPGVAYLEMARAAAEYAAEMSKQEETANALQSQVVVRLKHVVWANPLRVEEAPVQAHIGLYPEDSGEIGYEIYAKETDDRTVYSKGCVSFHRLEGDIPCLDVAAIQAECSQRELSATDCYKAFEAIGLSYGEGHRGIERIYAGQGQVLAKLKLPHSLASTEQRYVLHPCLMDSALQAAIGLLISDGTDKPAANTPALPFALEELDIFAPCKAEMWARLRYSKDSTAATKLQKLDIELCDEQGHICVRLNGFTSRVTTGETDMLSSSSGIESILFEPIWKEQATTNWNSPQLYYAKQMVILAAVDDRLYEHIATAMPEVECLRLRPGVVSGIDKAYESCAAQLFACIQQVIKSKPDGNVLIQLVTPSNGDLQILAGLAGMIKTARLENPQLIGQIIEVPAEIDGLALVEKLKENRHCSDDIQIRYAHGKRWVERWEGMKADNPNETVIPWKKGGVYLITGGAGGLGLLFAQEITRQTEKTTLILTGRSKLSAEKAARLQALDALGARVVYRQVDVTDKQAVDQLIQQIRIEFGSLNGIIHSAGIIRDNYILMKQVNELEEVLAPKVAGVVHLDDASKDEELDFFILFSSITAAMGNPGQADYAAANAFMDRFAERRHEWAAVDKRPGRTLSINWPLWKEGGMRVDEAAEKRMADKTGMLPLESQMGIRLLYQAYATGKNRIMAVHGHAAQMRASAKMPGSTVQFADHADRVDQAAAQASLRTASETAARDKSENQSINRSMELDKMQAYLMNIIADMLRVEPADIDVNVELTDYGLDQAMLAELAAAMNQTYKLDLPTTIFYEYATVNQFIGFSREVHFSLFARGEHQQEARETGQDVLQGKAEQFLKKQLSTVLKLPEKRIEADAPMELYGIDSLMVMQLTDQLETVFGSLSKTLFFEYQTIRELTTYFLKSHRATLIRLLNVKLEAVPVDLLKEVTLPVNQPMKSLVRNGAKQRYAQISLLEPQGLGVKATGSLDIAIIGLSGRYPGAENVNQFWDNLRNGKDSITEVPKDRWNYQLYVDESKSKMIGGKWGGFIEGVDRFDPLFFNISPREAEVMDPQERLFLECVYEAIEDAGYTRDALGASVEHDLPGQVGVYVGVMYEEYQLYGAQAQVKGMPFALSGSPASIANRVSYYFNFHGPSMAVDTMCSSSLTSIHLACQSLQKDECELAIAGGVNVSVHPNKYLMLTQGSFLSSKGRCESFGEGGDGYVPGEGVGAVLLKPLSKAIADGDHIYGVIKGTAINHGGKTNGYTVPNPNAQASVIGRALKEAGVHPRSVSYLEAHGTGTSLGDPIELAGLVKAFRTSTPDNQFCALGSAKSNIGHCESAAGIAGVTKVLLQLKHKQLAPSLHSATSNPNIDFSATPFAVQQELAEWKRPLVGVDGQLRESPRIAGISSFGAGGSNAHVIIEEYIPMDAVDDSAARSPQEPTIIVLSARNEERLQVQAKQLLVAIQEQGYTEIHLRDIAYTLQVGREAMEERLAIITDSMKELEAKLTDYTAGRSDIEDMYRGQVKRSNDMLAVFAVDEELQEAVGKWCERRKYDKLLELWVKGLRVDWSKLHRYDTPRRMSLPAYPFARERYWVPQVELEGGSTAGSKFTPPESKLQLHPLLHRNTSNLYGNRFSSLFTGAEFFLSDHQVNGQRVLPGAAHLEMARAAVEQAAGLTDRNGVTIRLKHVVWPAPLRLIGESIEAHIGLYLENDVEIRYEIYSEILVSGERTVYSQGRASIEEAVEAPRLNLSALRAACNYGILEGSECYEAFKEQGLAYGAGHQGIKCIFLGHGQVLAKLTLPSILAETEQQYVLHPSLIDSALQASIGLSMSTETTTADEPAVSLPFALDEMEVFAPCVADMWAYIRYSTGTMANDRVRKLDIELCDEEGSVSVRISGFASRVMPSAAEFSPANSAMGIMLLEPGWREQPPEREISAKDYVKHIVFLAQPFDRLHKLIDENMSEADCILLTAADASLEQSYRQCAVQLFQHVQALILSKPKGDILIQLVISTDGEQQVMAGLAGLLKTARQENPQLIGQLIETVAVEDAITLIEKLTENRHRPEDIHIRYTDGIRWVECWNERKDAVQIEAVIPWKAGGVYLITGGAGGLGLLFAQEIARQVSGATLILTGRSKLSTEKQVELQELETLGATAVYVQTDVADRLAVHGLIQHICDKFGHLNGIINSAGVIRDNYLLKKNVDELEEVLAPKVAGVVHLDEASKGLNLDFFILFSSLTGAMGNPGQADYAMANAFMDRFAKYRNELHAAGTRQGHTLSINWPLWKEGGMQVDAETEQRMLQKTGLTALQTDTGKKALYLALASQRSQIMVLEGDIQRLSSMTGHQYKGNPSNEVTIQQGESEEQLFLNIIEQIDKDELTLEQFINIKILALL